MRKTYYLIIVICTLLPCTVAAKTGKKAREPAPPPASGPIVQFDRGAKGGARNFLPVDGCIETPCVVTQHGAWRFSPETVGAYRVEMSYIHEGNRHAIGLFQQSTTLEQKFGERLLNRRPNRKIINLVRMIETGKTPIIYMYGILLQHDIREAEPVIITLTSIEDPTSVQEYYFRYHKTGAVPDIDISLLYPINFFHPNPGDTIQGATSGIAFSFSVGTNMDPEKHYGWMRKIMRAVRFNLFTGLLMRKELKSMAGDLVVGDTFDGFGGAGITLFDFLNLGYGINFARSPHSTFPFVGLEVRHVFEFLRSLKQDTHTRWEKYIRQEKTRGSPASKPRRWRDD